MYAVFGALFVPLLAVTLLLLNGRADWVGRLRNGRLTTVLLTATVVLFVFFGYLQLRAQIAA